MAKKTKLESDDWDFDDELDMPDFDFSPTPVKDDRNPATKIAVATAQGFKETALSSDNIRHLVKESLPRGYGEALDLADHTATTFKNIYHTAGKELKPVVNDIKKTAQKLVPVADKALPKGLAEKFRKFVDTTDKRAEYAQSVEDAKEASLQAELGQIFQAQAEDNQQRRAETDTRERMRDGIAFKRHKESTDILNEISQSIQQLAQYQSNVGVNYQRKSLELQFRHFFVARDALEETKRQNAVTTTNLEGILKNTGLPEYAKLKTTERLGEVVRNKFIDSIGDGVSAVRRNFVRNIGQKLQRAATDKIREQADQIRMGLGAVDTLAELQEMQAQMGQAQSGGEIAGGLVGSMGAGAATGWLAKQLNKKAHEHAGIMKKGNWLTDRIGQLPQRALKWANGWEGIGKSNIGAGSGWLDFIKSTIRDSLPQQDRSMQGDTLADTSNPDIFNRRTNRSITDIIPGYLARIYRELRIMRTGDVNQELVEYDFNANKFSESSKVTKNILNSLVGDGEKKSLKSETESIVDSLDTDNTLSPQQKAKLGRLLLKNNMKHGVGDGKTYSQAHADEYRGESSEDAEAFAEIFRKFFEDDESGAKQAVFGRQFGRLGDSLKDKRSQVQQYINAGQRDHLIKLGLLDKDNTMDMEKLYDYLLEGGRATPIPERQVQSSATPSRSLMQLTQPSGYGQHLMSRSALNGAIPSHLGLPVSARNRSTLSGAFSGYAEASNPQNWDIYHRGQQQASLLQSNRWNLTGSNRIGAESQYGHQNWNTFHGGRRANNAGPLAMAPMAQFGFTGFTGGLNASPQTPTRRDIVQQQTDAVQQVAQQVAEHVEEHLDENDDRRMDNRMLNAVHQVQDTIHDHHEERKAERERERESYSHNVNFDSSGIVSAIREESAKKPVEDLAEIVGRIEKKLNEGLTINGVVEGHTGGQAQGKRWWQHTLGDGIGNAFSGAGKAFKWGLDQAGKTTSRLNSGMKWGWEKASKAGQWAWNKANELNDIYVKGEVVPRLTKARLLAGDYYIKGRKTAIDTFEGIKEDIFDADGNLVISGRDLMDAVQNSSVGASVMRGLSWIKNTTKKQWDRGANFVPRAYKWAFDMAKKANDLVMGHVFDRPQDVYVVGDPNPKLTAVTMRGGGYKDRASGDPVTRVSQIKGPVVDDKGDVALSAEDIAKGLVDKNGKKIVTGYLGIAVKAWRGLNWAKDKMVKGLKTAKDWTMGKLGKLRDGLKNGDWGFSADLSLGLATGSKHQVTLLHQIRDMLNDRLPGEKTTFKEIDFGDGISSRVGKAAQKLKDKLKEKMPGFLEKLKEKRATAKAKVEEKKQKLKEKWEAEGGAKGIWQSTKDRARDAKEKAKEKLREYLDKHTESTEERKVRFEKIKEKKDALLARLAEKKEKAKEKAEAAKEKAKDKAATLKEKWDAFQQKRREAKEAKEHEDAQKNGIDLGDWGGEDDKFGRRRRGPKGKVGKLGRLAGKIRGSRLGQLAGRIGSSRAGTFLRGGGRLLGGAGRLLGGVGRAGLGLMMGDLGAIGGGLLTAGGGAASAIGGAASMAGSALAGAGSLAMGALGAIGSVLTAPVLLTAAAVAGVGIAGYFAYKYFTKKRLDTWNKIRYAQYGFLPGDEDHLQAVFGLEDLLKDAVVFQGQEASLDEKKVDFKKMAEAFNVDNSNQEQMQNFANWFVYRFKPVFLTHVAAVRSVAPQKWLDDVKDFKSDEKRKYLNIAKLPGGPYNVFTSPFTDQKQLAAGPQEVASAIAVAETELEQEAKKDSKGQAAGAAAGAAVGAAGAAKALENRAPTDNVPERLNLSEKPDEVIGKMDGGKLADLTRQTAGLATKEGAGVITVAGPDVMADVFNTGRLDAMTAIRYKTYGLKELAADKVRALALTEAEAYKKITVNKGKAEFNGSVETMLSVLGTAFGVVGMNNDAAYDWISWFNMRFLPTYLAYVTAVCTAAKKNDLKDAQLALRDLQAVDVATMTYTAKGTYDGGSASVWQIPTSPWPNYVLNNDVTTVDGNMQGLKDKARASTVSEETAKVETTGMEGGKSAAAIAAATKATTPNRPQDQPGFFSRLWGGSDGKGGVKGVLSSAWEGTKSFLGFGGGREVDTSGQGTGGLIDKIPKPKGSGTWNSVKDTISAASKMVGVDEKLMATMAAIESGFQWAVRAGSSSATGLYQFIKSTWDSMVGRFGGKYGIDGSTPPTDARANALMGAEYIKMNAEALKGVVKDRKLTDTDLYLAHFLGTGGAKKFLSANPNEIAANLFPDAARANPTIFYRDGRPLTVGEVYEVMNGKLRSRGKQFGIDDGSEKIQAPGASGALVQAGAPSASDVAKQTGKAGLTADGVENPTQNLLAKPAAAIPVSDQSAPGTPKASTLPSNGNAPASAGTDPMAAMSQRSRDVAAQQQGQRDAAADALNTTNQILAKSYDVQVQILSAANTLLKVVQDDVKARAAASVKGVMKEPIAPIESAPVSPAQSAPRSMTQPPVSMRKSTNYQ